MGVTPAIYFENSTVPMNHFWIRSIRSTIVLSFGLLLLVIIIIIIIIITTTIIIMILLIMAIIVVLVLVLVLLLVSTEFCLWEDHHHHQVIMATKTTKLLISTMKTKTIWKPNTIYHPVKRTETKTSQDYNCYLPIIGKDNGNNSALTDNRRHYRREEEERNYPRLRPGVLH